MRSDKWLWDNIVIPIYVKMFDESEPQLNFYNLCEGIKHGHKVSNDWFMEYYLSTERQQEIVDEICKEKKLTKRDKHKVSVSVFLGCSPSSYKGD